MPSFPTIVLYLRAGDHRNEILQQLATVPRDQRVLLVFPTRPASRMGLLDFRLLARQAEQRGIQLAITTRSPVLRAQAETAGLLVFATIIKARHHSWWKPEQENPRQPALRITPGEKIPHFLPPPPSVRIPRFRSRTYTWWEWMVFLIAITSMLGVIVYISSSAQITIPLEKETQVLQVTFTGSTEVLTANLAGQFPVHELNLILEAEGSAPATGSQKMPQDYAHGLVLLRNLTASPLTVPQGIVVTTLGKSPVRFATTRSITLPANASEASEVPIRAVLPGLRGNVSANSISAIEGSLGASLAVSNESATFGGTDTAISTPTQNDIRVLRTGLLAQLDQQAEQDFNAQLDPESGFLVDQSVTQSEIILEEITAQTGNSADEFTLSLRVRYTARMVSTSDLASIAEQLLAMSLSPSKTPLENTIRIEPVTFPVMQKDQVIWEVILQQQVYDQVDPETLAAFAGKPRTQLLQWLQTHLSLSGNPTITPTPRGWLWMPIFISNMEIIVL